MEYGRRVEKKFRVSRAKTARGEGWVVRYQIQFPYKSEWRMLLDFFDTEEEALERMQKLVVLTPLETENINMGRFTARHGCNYCAEARDIRGNTVDRDDDDTKIYPCYCVHSECPYEKLMESYGGYAEYDREMRRYSDGLYEHRSF